MAKKDDGLNLDLDLNDVNFDLDPVEDKRKPIVKISTSFGSSLMSELTSMRSLTNLAKLALPTGYGKAIDTASQLTMSGKQLWGTAAKELQPLNADIKKAVQRVLPKANKILPDSVQKKIDAMTKPEAEVPASQTDEEKNNGEIASTLTNIFQAQTQIQGQQNAQNNAYRQVRDQISDDQFTRSYAASAAIARGISRLVDYQDTVTQQYQRKSLELQYRQFFATRELLKVTAKGMEASIAHLKGIMHNTALPDFAKSNEFGKLENTLAKRLAESMFPQAQKFMGTYFANFTNEMGNRVRENLQSFIDAYRGVQDIHAMSEGMDKHTLVGGALGGWMADKVRGRLGSAIGKRFKGSKIIQRLGNRLGYRFANIPGMINRFTRDYTDHTQKHGLLLGGALNILRDILPPIGATSNVVSTNSLVKGDEAVTFNRATRQSLVEVIPGYLSRIHQELVIMRTGDINAPRVTWNPVKSRFTSARTLSKDVHNNIYQKADLERFQRGAADFVNDIDRKGSLSKEARSAIEAKLIKNADSGMGFDHRDFMNGALDVSPEVDREITEHFRRIFHLQSDGTAKRGSANYKRLFDASQAHDRAVGTMSGTRERINAMAEAGFLETLINAGIVKVDEKGQVVHNDDLRNAILLGKKQQGAFRDNDSTFHQGMAARPMGGMEAVATGGAGSVIDAEMIKSFQTAMEAFNKDTDDLLREMREGTLVSENKKQVQVLESILQVLNTRDFATSHIDEALKKAGSKFNDLKDKVVHWGEDGWAYIQDKYGKMRKVNVKNMTEEARAKLYEKYKDLRDNHGEHIDAAKRKATAAARLVRRKVRKWGGAVSDKYHEYMNKTPEGFFGHAGHFVGSGLGLVGSAASLGWKAGSGLFRGGLWAAGKTTGAAWGVTELGGRAVAGVGRGIRGAYRWFKDDVVDVYIDGQEQPCIYAKFMGTDRYRDAVDGKPIHSIKDIHGPVKDVVEDRIVLTAEEYAEGRWGSKARRIGKGIAGGIAGVARFLAKVTFAPFTIAKTAVRKIFSAARFLKRWVTYDTDIYVGDERMPRLEGTRMAQGKYGVVDKDGKVIKIVHKASDIVGPVKDLETGQFKIMQEDLDRGIYNALGHNITKTIKGAWNLATGLAALPFKAAAWAWKGATALGGAAASLVGGGLGGLIDHLNRGRKGFDDKQAITLMKLQLSTQKAIFQLLHERLKKPKNIRKGSWEEKFMQEHDAAAVAAKAGSGGKAGAGMFGGFGSLAGWLKNKFSKKKDDEQKTDENGNPIDDIQTGKDVWDGLKSVKGGIKNWRRLRQLKKLKDMGQLGAEGLEELEMLQKGTKIGRTLGRFGRIGQWGSRALQGIRGLRGAGMAAEGLEAAGVIGGGAEAAAATGAAATAATAAGGATVAAEAAGGAALVAEGGAAAGAIAAGVLTAPVLIGAAIVAAVGVGAYLAYKAWKNRGPKDLMKLRLAMYGVDMDNSREVEKVLNLEDFVSKNISIAGGQARFTAKGINQIKMMKEFGVDLGDGTAVNAFIAWFNGRFRPVLCETMAALSSVAPQVKLVDADRELKPKQKQDLLDKLKLISRQYYQVDANPFSGQRKWLFWKVGSVHAGTHSVDVAFKEAQAAISAEVEASKKDENVFTEMGKGFLKFGPLGALKAGWDAIMHNKDAAANRKAEAEAKKKGAQAGGDKNQAAKAAVAATAAAAALAGGGTAKLQSNVVKFPTLSGSVLTANQCIRYKQYGVTDLSRDKVAVLFAMETYVLDKVSFEKDSQANFTDDVNYYYDTYASQFGVVNGDKDTRKTWLDWFKARFLPTLLAYATAVNQVNANIKVLDAESYLKPTDLLQVAKSMMGAKAGKEYSNVSVWSIPYSPWPNYKVNLNQDSTKPNMDYLQSQVDKQKLDEQKGVPYKKDDQSNGEKAGTQGAMPNPLLPKGQPDQKPKPFNPNNDPNNYGGGFGIGYANGQGRGNAAGGMTGFGGNSSGVSTSTPLVDQPGNGTGGDINKIPLPGPGASWASARPTIEAAANMAGVDPGFLGTVAGIESGFNPSIKSPTSSATGYFQLIGDTWRTMLKKYGPKYGIAPNTPPTDPRANALLGAEYVRENMEYLKRNLGGKLTQTDLYLAHFLGPAGAVDLLRMPPNSIAAQAMPKAAAANKSIFFDKNGRPRTVAEVIQLMDGKLASRRVNTGPSSTGADLGPITGLPGSTNGMAGSIAKAGANTVSPTVNADGSTVPLGTPSPAAGGQSPSSLSAATAGSSGPSGPASLSPSSVKPIAATPTPNIASAAPSGGGSMYGGDDSSVVNSRVQMQRSAAANDDVSRQATAARSAEQGQVADILAKSLQVQSSMDGTLKAILGVLGKGGSPTASAAVASATPGPVSSPDASASSVPLAPPAVSLDRRYGG